MRNALLAGILVILLFPFRSQAQLPSTPDGAKQPRILILLDGSSSMLQPWGRDLKRFSAAGKIVAQLMDSIYAINSGVEFGLRVYGHQFPAQENNCTDTRREVMFSKNNFTQMSLRLAALHPLGVSPIAFSLKEAAENDLEDELRNAYAIILITDGGESCGGNICDVVQTLIQRKIFFRPYVLGMVDYAPLKEQYACLGKLLTVAKESDIPVAIKEIADAYRPMLMLPIIAQPKPVTAKPVVADVRVVPVVVPVVAPKTVIAVPVPERREMPLLAVVSTLVPFESRYRAPAMRRRGMPAYTLPRMKGLEDDVPKAVEMPLLPFVHPGTYFETFHYSPLPRKRAMPALIMPKMKGLEEETPKLSSAGVKPVVTAPVGDPSRTMVAAKPLPVDKPAIKLPVKDTMRTTVAIKPLPVIKPSKMAKPTITRPRASDMPAITSVEDAKETTTAIYFTDGHGKFYHTSPEMQLLDIKTGKVVKEFYRTVGPTGEPDLQNLPAGTYNLMIAGRARLITRNVVIQPNKKNKILIPVSNGSISFVYTDAPERPVEEFDAIVGIRFEPGPTGIKQNCADELPYPPGNYHVVVNTLPEKVYNVDVDFGSESALPVPQPGYVQIANLNALGSISFYYPLGDRYVRFHGLSITGNPELQRLRLLPGAYEVHWTRNASLPYASEAVQKFLVRPNMLTEIELH